MVTAADCRAQADEWREMAGDFLLSGEHDQARRAEFRAAVRDDAAHLRDLDPTRTIDLEAIVAARNDRPTIISIEVDGVHLLRADRIAPESVDYLEATTIPLRVVTLMVGLDGVGKSTVLYDRASRATRGQLPGKFFGEPVDVVIASSEDHPASVIVPRLIAAGADLTRAHVVKVHRDGLTGDIALPDDMDALAREVQKVHARLLIVDPLIAHLPMNIDSHKAQHVRQALAPLARLAEESHLSVCAVVHFNGAASTDVRSRISGSKSPP